MRFAGTAHDESLADLAKRVYRFEGEPAEERLDAARRTLAGANPFLEAEGAMPEGTVVAVPLLDGAEYGAETGEADATAIGITGRQLDGAVALARVWIAEQLSEQDDLQRYAKEAFGELDADLAELTRAFG